MNPLHDYVRYESRRQFFSRGANAVGWAALAALLGREGLMPAAEAAGLDRSITTGQDPLPPQGEACHLPAHGRRSVPDGHVRLQAADEQVV